MNNRRRICKDVVSTTNRGWLYTWLYSQPLFDYNWRTGIVSSRVAMRYDLLIFIARFVICSFFFSLFFFSLHEKHPPPLSLRKMTNSHEPRPFFVYLDLWKRQCFKWAISQRFFIDIISSFFDYFLLFIIYYILFIIYYLYYLLYIFYFFLFTCIHDMMFDVAQVSGTGVRARSISVDGKLTVQL